MLLLNFAVFLLTALPAEKPAWRELPETRSPNGLYVIAYQEPFRGTAREQEALFWIVRRSDNKQMSPQLLPGPEELHPITGDPSETPEQKAAFNRGLMFTLIARYAKADDQREAADSQRTKVTWAPDSTEVKISGGRLQFSYSVTYALRGGWFMRLREGPAHGVDGQ